MFVIDSLDPRMKAAIEQVHKFEGDLEAIRAMERVEEEILDDAGL